MCTAGNKIFETRLSKIRVESLIRERSIKMCGQQSKGAKHIFRNQIKIGTYLCQFPWICEVIGACEDRALQTDVKANLVLQAGLNDKRQ